MSRDTIESRDTTASILQADDFLRNCGILSNVQKNNLVLVTLSSCPEIKRVAFDINVEKYTIEVLLFLNWWHMLFFSTKTKIVEKLAPMYHEYLPLYTINIEFKRYGSKKENSTQKSR